MDNDILKAVYKNGDDLLSQLSRYLDQGGNASEINEYGESFLRVASNNGRFDVVKLLLDHGADESQLEWTEIFHSLAFEGTDRLEELITSGADIGARDRWSRTPFLFSILLGDRDKIQMLIDAGADTGVVGRCEKSPLAYAIQKDDATLLKWLVEKGFDPEQRDKFKNTPLMVAVQYNAIHCVDALIEIGVDIFKARDYDEQAIGDAYDLNIVLALLNAGADINDVMIETRAEMLGYSVGKAPDISKAEYEKGRGRTFGKSNPEISDNPFWQAMVKSGGNAYSARAKFEKEREVYNFAEPVWCFDRFGKSLTPLGDGRFIEIAGEHEDHYDPDFCIYNDVFLHSGKGSCDIYTYPRDIFPPTDFHTATLIGGQIYIIGNLGYVEDRKPGYTQVYRLDITSFKIEKIKTSGDMPGWINRHKAQYDGTSSIHIKGGMLITDQKGKEGYIPNQHNYALCLKSLEWTRIYTT